MSRATALRERPRPGERPARRAPRGVQRAAAAVAHAGGRVADLARRVVAGDRPLIAGLVALLGLAVVVLSGPLQSYWDGRERVTVLEAKHDALTAEITELEDRVEALNDPEEIELLAREQQGFIRPGEVPYVVVPPEVDRPQITPPRDDAVTDAPWYRGLWDTIASWLG